MIALRGITWDHPRGYQPLAASADPYASSFGVRVTWDRRSLKDFGDAPIDQLATDYDLLIIDHPHVGLTVESGCLLPLDRTLDSEVLALLAAESAGPSHASYTYAGHQWALAVDAAMQAAAYRPDLLNEPLPQSWDAVLALAGSLQQAGLTIAVPLAPTDCICSFLSLCASLGEAVGTGDNLVSAAVGCAALDYLQALAGVAHPGSLSWNPIAMLDHMSGADDIAYCPFTFCYTNYARAAYAPHIVRFTMIPGVQGSLLGGAGIAVSASCAHPEAASAYAAWICSAEVQRTFYVQNGGQPGNRVAWFDPDANVLTHQFFHDTWETLRQAYVRPRHNGFVVFQEGAGRMIHALLRGENTVNDTFARLQTLYRDTLPRA